MKKTTEKEKKLPTSPSFIVEREVKRNQEVFHTFSSLLEDARKIQNTVAGNLQRRIRRMWNDPRFQEASKWNAKAKELRVNKQVQEAEVLKEKAKVVFKDLHKTYRLSQSEAEKDGKEVRVYFYNRLDAVTTQKACIRAWIAAKEYLYRKSKKIHFIRYGENHSFEGKSNKASLRVVLNEKGNDTLVNLGSRQIKLRPIKRNDLYLQETMSHLICSLKETSSATEKNAELQRLFLNSDMTNSEYLARWQSTYRVKYNRLVRKRIRGKERFFIQMVVEGYPVPKRNQDGSFRHELGMGRVGNDIGLQSIATSANEHVSFQTLAPNSEIDERRIALLQRKLDRQRRANNPENYDEKGRIKKGRKIWNHSKSYFRTKEKLKEIQRKASVRRKLWHQTEVNRLVGLGDVHIIEKVSWSGLAKQAKETKVDPKTGRPLRKKRYGKSIGFRAPALFVSLYEQKVKALGGDFHYVKMNTYKASQYDHTTQQATKKKLSERWTVLSTGQRVQRDIYSAFLLQHPNTDLSHPQWDVCEEAFLSFYDLHQRCIQEIQSNQIHAKNSGIVV